ncbi:hypothetical protein PILCRDRAFT_92390 [Piloderma croceum F 1598]|uniref:Uncharacterized protein n=1 Tax=Piloderma croceum (strain F 1598) TaxID=765440 RepID=A0A0C3F4S6_PILCF|nr:hypothetical protein PILCRDRAFT_92390 [Piloderma croceum F 1598]
MKRSLHDTYEIPILDNHATGSAHWTLRHKRVEFHPGPQKVCGDHEHGHEEPGAFEEGIGFLVHVKNHVADKIRADNAGDSVFVHKLLLRCRSLCRSLRHGALVKKLGARSDRDEESDCRGCIAVVQKIVGKDPDRTQEIEGRMRIDGFEVGGGYHGVVVDLGDGVDPEPILDNHATGSAHWTLRHKRVEFHPGPQKVCGDHEHGHEEPGAFEEGIGFLVHVKNHVADKIRADNAGDSVFVHKLLLRCRSLCRSLRHGALVKKLGARSDRDEESDCRGCIAVVQKIVGKDPDRTQEIEGRMRIDGFEVGGGYHGVVVDLGDGVDPEVGRGVRTF